MVNLKAQQSSKSKKIETTTQDLFLSESKIKRSNKNNTKKQGKRRSEGDHQMSQVTQTGECKERGKAPPDESSDSDWGRRWQKREQRNVK